jgi:hypothetical protein
MGVIDSLRRGFIAKPGKRKRTKAEAKERIRSLPTPPSILVPPVARPIVRAAPLLAEALIDVDPLGLTAPAPQPRTVIPTTSGTPTQQIQPRVTQMATQDTIREMINDPMIVLDEQDVALINDPAVMMDMNGQLMRSQFAEQFSQAQLLREKPKKRKVSKYQKELGRQLKMLKKKHPRTKVTALMKRAHRATRKALSK